MMKFSANLGFLWTELTLPEAIRAAHAAGFDAVECHQPYGHSPMQVKETLLECGLEMLSLNTRLGENGKGDNGVASFPNREQEARGLIDESLDYAAQIGCRNVHVLAGRSGGGNQAESAYRSNLTYACERAAEHGISILIEPLNTRDVPDYHLTGIEAGIDTISAVGLPNLKLMFDCYHVQIMQGDLTERLRNSLPFIGHVQIAGVPERNEPDRGEVNFKNLCRTLDSLDYRGFIGAEYQPGLPMDESLKWMRDFKGSVSGQV